MTAPTLSSSSKHISTVTTHRSSRTMNFNPSYKALVPQGAIHQAGNSVLEVEANFIQSISFFFNSLIKKNIKYWLQYVSFIQVSCVSFKEPAISRSSCHWSTAVSATRRTKAVAIVTQRIRTFRPGSALTPLTAVRMPCTLTRESPALLTVSRLQLFLFTWGWGWTVSTDYRSNEYSLVPHLNSIMNCNIFICIVNKRSRY